LSIIDSSSPSISSRLSTVSWRIAVVVVADEDEDEDEDERK